MEASIYTIADRTDYPTDLALKALIVLRRKQNKQLLIANKLF